MYFLMPLGVLGIDEPTGFKGKRERNMISQDYLDRAIQKAKDRHYRYFLVRDIVVRPLLPQDFGKETWLWDSSTKVVIAPRISTLIYGILSDELLKVSIMRPYGCVAILTNPVNLYGAVVYQQEEDEIIIEVESLEGKPVDNRKIKFAILGYTIERKDKMV